MPPPPPGSRDKRAEPPRAAEVGPECPALSFLSAKACRIVQKLALGPGGVHVGGESIHEHGEGPDQAPSHPRLTKPPAQTVLHLGLGEHQGQGLPVSRPPAPPRALSILRKKKCGPPTTPDTPVGNRSPQSQPSSHSQRLGGQRGSKVSPPQTPALSLSPLWGSLLLFPSCERQPSPGPPLGHPSLPLCEALWAGALLGLRPRGLVARPKLQEQSLQRPNIFHGGIF